MKVIDFRIWSNICSRLLYCEFVGFEVLSDVHAQCFLIRICFGVRIIGATDVDKHLCEQITKILWIWNLVVNSMQREGAATQSSKVVKWPNSVLVAPLLVALQRYSVAPLRVARPKGAATPPSEKCSPYWAGAHNGMTAGICRASGVGATSLLHNDCFGTDLSSPIYGLQNPFQRVCKIDINL